MAKQCDICDNTFKNAHGVAIHKLRNKSCGSKGSKGTWGGARVKKQSKKRENGREVIRQLLKDQPGGLSIVDIRDQLKQKGLKVSPTYVSQATASDHSLVRVGRGVYRLRANVRRQDGAAADRAEQDTGQETQTGIASLPREALLLRIETLESQNRALQDAHMSLIRGVFA